MGYECHNYGFILNIRGKPGETKCVCASGFQAVGSSVDEQGRLIELCEDIDECALYPCPTVEECKNTPGGFICTRDPTIAVRKSVYFGNNMSERFEDCRNRTIFLQV
ncbi:unnamed protein product [Strongylus vulgaris]|uniref:Uncharacterized protein n=1 Tax=Strongylus vulgaris TaxID=40348 RepID=A0A3P7J2V9_STRVU|nr:unnamed protein product [Strongylus vulgaris]